MEVRGATTSDVDEIAFVHVESWRSTYRGLVPDDFLAGLSVERRKEAWSKIVENSSARKSGVLVLEDADTVVGFSHHSPSRDDDAEPSTGEITSTYLLASHWRRGGGSLLLEAAKDALRSGGFDAVTLWVLDGNVAARAFYERLGWHHDGGVKVDDRGSFELRELRYQTAL